MSGLTDIPQEKMEEAMQKSCEEQEKLLAEAAKLTCAWETTAQTTEEE